MDKNGNIMKQLIVIILAFVAMTFADGMSNGTGFFVNSEYIVTAYHVVDEFEHKCYYDIKNDTCYKIHMVDYDLDADIVMMAITAIIALAEYIRTPKMSKNVQSAS